MLLPFIVIGIFEYSCSSCKVNKSYLLFVLLKREKLVLQILLLAKAGAISLHLLPLGLVNLCRLNYHFLPLVIGNIRISLLDRRVVAEFVRLWLLRNLERIVGVESLVLRIRPLLFGLKREQMTASISIFLESLAFSLGFEPAHVLRAR
jgi:hypothetical protein